MQKARRHRINLLRPLVGTRFQDLFHSLIQGSFHLSLTVLVHYRSLKSIQSYQMVLVDSDRISHVPPYSGYYQLINAFRIQVFHLLWTDFPDSSSIRLQCTLQSYNPSNAETLLVWAISISLATTPEITIVFSSSAYLDVSVQRVCAFLQLTSSQLGFPIRKSTDRKVFAPPRSLSQLITSFIASETLGIPRVPLVTYQFFYSITTSINSNISKNFVIPAFSPLWPIFY